jgi:flagellar biosynthesis protein FlhA
MASAATMRPALATGGSGFLASPFFLFIHKHRGLMIPAGFIGMIMVLLVPLPPVLLDMLLVTNLAIAAIVLVSVMFVNSPLELSIFPSLLLGTTLFRLVLNVASTRLILTAGDRATNLESAAYAAGHVIYTFSTFVAGSSGANAATHTNQSMIVGIIIFIILIVIQFVVITKGASRISEVAARFTLDAMPGKQMAIDADLNAGLIKEDEARRRRLDIARESEFYGAMDGASKFVRGDAVAGIIIVFINIIGGIAIGKFQYGWDLVGCLSMFTRLTIGDGLVSQVPALVISLAAGLLVTRSSSKENLGEEFIQQLTGRSLSLFVVAGFLVVMAFTGMPILPLISLALFIGGTGWVMTRNKQAAAVAAMKQEKAAASQKKPEKIESLLAVDPMELEVGYQLVQLVDTTKGGDLLERISLIRRQIAIEFGVVVPPIRIRDNMQLDPNGYVIKMRGNPLATGLVYPGQYLAMDSGAASGKLIGTETREPAFGLPAWWIPENQRSQAEMMNYTVVEASGVLATHITEVVKTNASELVTRDEVAALLKQLKEKSPALVEEVVPSQIKPGELQKVLHNLLRERVPIRDLETILETLGEWASKTKDLDVLTEAVRHGLARTICNQYRDEQNTIHCVTLDPALEDTINGYVERNERGSFLTLPPQMARQITENVAAAVAKLMQQGFHGVVLCSPQVRAHVRKLIESSLPAVAVLSYNEITRGMNVESVGIVGVTG